MAQGGVGLVYGLQQQCGCRRNSDLFLPRCLLFQASATLRRDCRNARPRPAKPSSIVIHFAGSGTLGDHHVARSDPDPAPPDPAPLPCTANGVSVFRLFGSCGRQRPSGNLPIVSVSRIELKRERRRWWERRLAALHPEKLSKFNAIAGPAHHGDHVRDRPRAAQAGLLQDQRLFAGPGVRDSHLGVSEHPGAGF